MEKLSTENTLQFPESIENKPSNFWSKYTKNVNSSLKVEYSHNILIPFKLTTKLTFHFLMEDSTIKNKVKLEFQLLSNILFYFSKKTLKRKYKNFYMVAGGTGITPLYQIIQYITENELESSPNLHLLFANRT